MIKIYQKSETGVISSELVNFSEVPEEMIWMDLINPTQAELEAIRNLGIEIPSEKEVWKNHVLNRLYLEDGVAYMTAAIITKLDSPYPATTAVTFILDPNYLITVRTIEPTSFVNFSKRLQKPNEYFPTAYHVLEGLMEEIITRVAHNSELVVDTLDDLSHNIFGLDLTDKKAKSSSEILKNVLRKLGSSEDLNSKINESLHSIIRMLGFFRQISPNDTDLLNNIGILQEDAIALTKQTGFLSSKINFQLDATLGMINVEQNLITKIFSVATVFFLPPTMVSSLYGMNFKHMPELEWMMGYPMAITLMVIFAVLPYVYFRKKGWL